jgi:poly-gamma-glutamate synthesis protein (capsule biosynthesis protein)
VCVLANNHVLDFGHAGLRETLEALSRAGLGTAGAGRTLAEARAPAVVEVSGKGRLVVFGFGDDSSGIPSGWAATNDRPGIDFLPDLSAATATGIVNRVREVKRARDIVVASIHWGSNWGYQVPPAQRRFARWLLDGGVDIVHGHSSHHVRPIEIYRGKLILYGCGDFLDDYEGIAGYEEFRDDLTLMYFPTLQPETGRLESLRMTPMQIRNLKANRAAPADAEWLGSTLGRISQPFGAHVELTADGTLALHRMRAAAMVGAQDRPPPWARSRGRRRRCGARPALLDPPRPTVSAAQLGSTISNRSQGIAVQVSVCPWPYERMIITTLAAMVSSGASKMSM